MPEPALPILAVSISVLSFVVATANYRRKSGISVRGSFQPTSSIASPDDYISNLQLQNEKDRAVTIYAIYLKIGYNTYLELQDFEKEPLILRAFESYSKTFGPIEFHESSTRRIRLGHLLMDRTAKKSLILSTSAGKYKVPSRIRVWSPIAYFFSNHLTAIVRPIRIAYKGTEIGGNHKFVLEISYADGHQEVIAIQPQDYQLLRFKTLKLTKTILESAATFQTHLNELVQAKSLVCESATVIDLDEWRAKYHQDFSKDTVAMPNYTAFDYFVRGRILTRKANSMLRKQNESYKKSKTNP